MAGAMIEEKNHGSADAPKSGSENGGSVFVSPGGGFQFELPSGLPSCPVTNFYRLLLPLGVGNGSENRQGGPSAPEGSSTGSTEPGVKRRGRCKWFNVAKGWGFITPDDGTQDVFVHQSVIKMTGFRSLGDEEVVEFMCKTSDKGLEATHVSGIDDSECKGSSRRPVSRKKIRKIRCYNCGEFANHIAAKCTMDPQPKRCHLCKSEKHLIADCPLRPSGEQEEDDDQQLTNNGTAEQKEIPAEKKALK